MPHLIIIAGSNGSGKTTAASALLKDSLHVNDFVNADMIAQGLCAYQPEKTSIQAGRIMLETIRSLAKQQVILSVNGMIIKSFGSHQNKYQLIKSK